MTLINLILLAFVGLLLMLLDGVASSGCCCVHPADVASCFALAFAAVAAGWRVAFAASRTWPPAIHQFCYHCHWTCQRWHVVAAASAVAAAAASASSGAAVRLPPVSGMV